MRYAASDDDITYTIMGMLLIEKAGKGFSLQDMRQLWLENLPIYCAGAPRRTVLLRAGLAVSAPICAMIWTVGGAARIRARGSFAVQ